MKDDRTNNRGEEQRKGEEPKHINPAEIKQVSELAERLAVSEEDVRDAMQQVGDDPQKIEEMLRGRENSY